MKYIIRLMIAVFLLTGCASKNTTETSVSSTDTATTTEENTKAKYTGPEKEKGKGKMYIITDGGSTEDGIIPVLYVDVDDLMVSVELDAWGYDGKHLSFIYVDHVLNDKEQMSDIQMTLMLSGDELKEGVHKVQVVQYEDDDPAGEILSYHEGSYEVKIIK